MATVAVCAAARLSRTSGRFLLPSFGSLAAFPSRSIRMFKPKDPYTNVNQPQKYRLPVVPKVPSMWQANVGMKQPKGSKELYRYFGEERVHNDLVLGQYGIVAISGGALKFSHFEYMRNKISRYLEENESFAIYRVDAPYKPFTSKSGKRMGGGKGNIKGYSTPLKAGRVIVEVGGRISWEETQPWLSRIAASLPIEAIAVSKDLLDRLNTEEKRLEKCNQNPFTLEWMIRNNINDCQNVFTPYDIKYFGKFTYKDRHNNKMWKDVLLSNYKRK